MKPSLSEIAPAGVCRLHPLRSLHSTDALLESYTRSFRQLHTRLIPSYTPPRPAMAPRRSRFAALSVAGAAFVVCTLATAPLAAAFKTGTSGSDVVPGSYIIQVNTSSAALSKRGMTPFTVRLSLNFSLFLRNRVVLNGPLRATQALEHTLAAVSNQGVQYSIRQRFDAIPDAFMGVSMQVGDDVTMEQLAQISGVEVRVLLPFPECMTRGAR